MRQIQYTRPGLGLTDVPEPLIVSPTDVKIRVSHASLCGSDLHILRGDFDWMWVDARTVPLGHEASGVVAELGPEATAKNLSVGDRVTFYFNKFCGACHYCRSGKEQFCTSIDANTSFMSDVVVVDEQQVFTLPDTTSLAAAALIEPTSVALRGIDLVAIRPGETVAVFGGGGIGQIAASLARLSGATNLTLIEPVADKRALALKRGAVHVIDPTVEDLEARAAEITNGRGFDVVIEASGSARAGQSATTIAGRGARVEFLATYAPTYTFEFPMDKSFTREITVITGVCMSPYVFPRAVAISAELDLDDLITVFPVEQFHQGFDAQSNGLSVKTVFDFSSEGATP